MINMCFGLGFCDIQMSWHRSSADTPVNAPADSPDATSPATTSSADSAASRPWVATPAVLRCGNGPELACVAMAGWARERAGLHVIPPGEPWRNGYAGSFSSRIRDECLNVSIFWSLAQAGVVITDWKEDCSHRRRHSSPGCQTPVAFAAARANDTGLPGHPGIPAGGPRSQAVSPDARLRTWRRGSSARWLSPGRSSSAG